MMGYFLTGLCIGVVFCCALIVLFNKESTQKSDDLNAVKEKIKSIKEEIDEIDNSNIADSPHAIVDKFKRTKRL